MNGKIGTKGTSESGIVHEENKTPQPLRLRGFRFGADCETRTRDLLITKVNSRVFYRSIVLHEMLIYQG